MKVAGLIVLGWIALELVVGIAGGAYLVHRAADWLEQEPGRVCVSSAWADLNNQTEVEVICDERP